MLRLIVQLGVEAGNHRQTRKKGGHVENSHADLLLGVMAFEVSTEPWFLQNPLTPALLTFSLFESSQGEGTLAV